MIIIHGGRVLRPGALDCEPLDVIVEHDTIADLVPPASVSGDTAQRIDASGKLLIPGLVNGHTHAQVTLARGMFDRYTLELYLNAMAWTTGRRTLEDKYVSAAIGAAEMVRKGCTAAYDMFAEFPLPTVDGVDAVARAYSDVGMRAVIAPMLADRSFYRAIPGLLDVLPDDLRDAVLKIEYAPHSQTVAACRAIIESWAWDRECVRPALGPTIPHHCSDEFLIECRNLATELDIGIQMHVAESKLQAIAAQRRYSESMVAHLDTLGLLGPHFCASHGIWIDAHDRGRLAAAGASIAHNPGSNFKLGSGMADLRRMLDSGINVALGTDGCASSDNLNPFEVMRLAAFVSRVGDHPVERWVTSREALHAATEGGAQALGFDRIGRIAPGYKADIVFIDLGALHYVPLNDIANQLVFCEDGTGVESVMIGGRMVLDRGAFTTIDPLKLRTQAEEAVARLTSQTREGRALSERLAPFVGQYCSGLAATWHHVHRLWNGAEDNRARVQYD
jgi:5-methylthioadenosine/S-adenosylhomocysteine deaminase